MVRSGTLESTPLTVRSWVEILGLVVVAAALFVASGPLGLLAGLAIAASWLVLSGPSVVAAGHLLALAVVDAEPALWFLIPFELGFLAVLVAPSMPDVDWLRTAGLTAVFSAVLGGFVLHGWTNWRPRWLVALSFLLVVAIALYAVHRLTVVRLDLAGVNPIE